VRLQQIPEIEERFSMEPPKFLFALPPFCGTIQATQEKETAV
jgi:hypothetical protein